MTQPGIDDAHAVQRVTARTLGMAVAVYGYPLVEMLRKCRLQTRSNFDPPDDPRPPIDALHHGLDAPDGRTGVPCEKGVVYSTAWINLGQGVRHLHFKGTLETLDAMSARTSVTLYSAYGEVIEEFGYGALRPGGVVLVGPHTHPALQGPAFDYVRCTTGLVWLVGRTQTEGDAAATLRRLLATLRVDGPLGTMNGRRPAAVELWEGEERDAFASLLERPGASERLALFFYANLCHAFAQSAPRGDECQLIASLRKMGLGLGGSPEWRSLKAPLREGLVQGFEDAARAVGSDEDAARVASLAAPMRRAIAAWRGWGGPAVR